MAKRRPLSELSPAYRKRIQRAIERGLILENGSRQRARGKPVDEYVQRKRREAERTQPGPLGGLTPGQKAQVTRFAKKMAGYDPSITDDDDINETVDALQSWATRMGYDRFLDMRSRQASLVAQYREERATNTYVQRPGLLSLFTQEFAIDDIRWFFYH